MEINDRPVVVEFVVGADAQVWPMVAAGMSNDEINVRRDIRPEFEHDELAASVDQVADVTERSLGDASIDTEQALEGEK